MLTRAPKFVRGGRASTIIEVMPTPTQWSEVCNLGWHQYPCMADCSSISDLHYSVCQWRSVRQDNCRVVRTVDLRQDIKHIQSRGNRMGTLPYAPGRSFANIRLSAVCPPVRSPSIAGPLGRGRAAFMRGIMLSSRAFCSLRTYLAGPVRSYCIHCERNHRSIWRWQSPPFRRSPQP